MLNYIWAGLIICSLVFAVGGDVTDLSHDTFHNGRPLPVALDFKSPYNAQAAESPVDVTIDRADYAAFYGVTTTPATSYAGTLVRSARGLQLRFARDATLPEPLATVRDATQAEDVAELRGVVRQLDLVGNARARAAVVLQPVRFYRLARVANAAISMAKGAASLALGLIGVLALWMGVMRIAEKSGLIDVFVRLVRPILHPLFPEIPKDHPALGMIALNLSAGMLGLGNAATPMGLKAMEELQKLNKSQDTATNPMVMLLALNTTCPQLVPSPTLVAMLGLAAGEVWLPTVLATSCAMVVAIVMTKLLGRIGGYRRTDPDLLPATAPTPQV